MGNGRHSSVPAACHQRYFESNPIRKRAAIATTCHCLCLQHERPNDDPKMADHDKSWLKMFGQLLLVIILASIILIETAEATKKSGNSGNLLTACQHQRRAESRRAKAFASVAVVESNDQNAAASNSSVRGRVPRCNKRGKFERIQCRNEKTTGRDCWCVDEYGIEIPGTHNSSKSLVRCTEPEDCPASACRMFCPSGFARDPQSGCTICRCRDPCAGFECPNGQACQLQEVKCRNEPCPPVPTCRKARAITNFCPAGLPLAIEGSARPFLCGHELGKPQCPPMHECLVENGNDYGVCCPSALKFQKPGLCPAAEEADYTVTTGYMCGPPCTHDLECRNMEKCCPTRGCQFNCRAPYNVTTCHQARALADMLAVSEREGRSYTPDCNGPGGMFTPRQCSRNGLVCWCVDPRTGHKIPNSMGAAGMIDCDGWENMISRSRDQLARSLNMEQCDTNICAAVCEYGFKNDHNGCPTCECSEACEGFKCPMGTHCEVASDSKCNGESVLCASWPICKPDLVYSNPCLSGTPLADNITGEVMYCFEERQSRQAFQPQLFFDDAEPEMKQARSMTNRIECPATHKCMKLHGEAENVCCPLPEKIEEEHDDLITGDVSSSSQLNSEPETSASERQQTMCEYLRDFSDRMEGTEFGMQLAIEAPQCNSAGDYRERQCTMRTIRVTRAEQRKILEENTIRRMRALLSDAGGRSNKRNRRDVEPLKLYRVSDAALRVNVAAPVMGRSAKVIDMGGDRERQQTIGQQLFEVDVKKTAPATKRPQSDTDQMVDLEVEECWCVDAFGTVIPRSRGFNVTDEDCVQLRNDIDCLDITCRMGCEYGFVLDSNSRCPACQCRDPCDGVSCGETKECRIVDVSCEEEYCPPVPACLPRKAGQCPFLVPPGPENIDANACAYECRTDSHCDGAKRCCSNGCGTQCVEPQMRTACQHLLAIQLHQSSELGIPAKKMHVAQCDPETGGWATIQCSLGRCWCVDASGQELAGTRILQNSTIDDVASAHQPDCKGNSENKRNDKCPNADSLACSLECEAGYLMDENGCRTCKCRDFCEEINCAIDEECQLITVECIDTPCPRMPICVPRRESLCPEGSPLKQSGNGGELDVSCGPHNEQEACPTTHTCQLNPMTHRGVCCAKTRDVCFESMDSGCQAKGTSERNATRYRFSPKANKCVPVTLDLDGVPCQTKNLFHTESACNSVCPVLTQCERLKLKNNLAAERTGHTSVWFQPRCDPITGHWSPVQCLGKQPAVSAHAHQQQQPSSNIMRRSFDTASPSTAPDGAAQLQEPPSPYGVCWCADKKGAPLKGSLIRDSEPTCNSRQGRRRKVFDDSDPLMEELIRQITMLNDVDATLAEEERQQMYLQLNYDNEAAPSIQSRMSSVKEDEMMVPSSTTTTTATVIPSGTERVLELANSLLDSQLSMNLQTMAPMQIQTTRCRAFAATASFPVTCNATNGAFLPTQCNNKLCWCVDAAGNQLDATEMFSYGTKECPNIPIDAVAIELHMQNTTERIVRNAYEHIRNELQQLLGHAVENLRVQENFDGSALLRFELHNDAKVDTAFAIESAIASDSFRLAGGHFRPDITRSHFVHRSNSVTPPMAQAVVLPESTIQLVLFIIATSSALLVSVVVIYMMLKRSRHNKSLQSYSSTGDKPVDFSAPIFVLSPAASKELEAAKGLSASQ